MHLTHQSFILFALFFTPKAFAINCIDKVDTIGNLEVRQTITDGQCVISVLQNSPVKDYSQRLGVPMSPNQDMTKRRYSFTSEGAIRLFDKESIQEIQLLDKKAPLNYVIQNGNVIIQLPGGQKMTLGINQSSTSGLVRSFEGFSQAKESSRGFELTPNGTDTLLQSSALKGKDPYEIPSAKFDLMTAEGKQNTFATQEIFVNSKTNFPVLKKSFTWPKVVKPAELATSKVAKLASSQAPLAAPKISEPTNSSKAEKLQESTPDFCAAATTNVKELNAEYLRIQGELTLSKLAYYYLRDLGDTSEKLESKIKNLLKAQANTKAYQNIIDKKVRLNSSLIQLKDLFLETQKKWTSHENSDFLLNEFDFKYLSLVSELEKDVSEKSDIINFIRMIDSSYQNSDNSKEEKLRALDKRFKQLSLKKEKIVNQLIDLQTKCVFEAAATCEYCLLKQGNVVDLKNVIQKNNMTLEFKWGSFWLHTGKKGK